MTHVVVVGGGITGLAAAWEASRAGADVTVLEASERFGGKLLTTAFAGRPVDAGADAFLARVPEGVALCAELGIADQLVSPAATAAYLYVDGALRRLPDGLVLGVPVDLDAVNRSGVVGAAVVERPGPRLAPDEDPSVGELVRARFGDAVATRLVDPLVGGINVGDTDRLSVRATMPQLAEAATTDELVSAGLRRLVSGSGTEPGSPLFHSLPGGMGSLVDTLVGALLDAGVDLRPGRPLDSIDELRPWQADAAVLTAPAPATAALLADLAPGAASALAGIEYASVALVTLAVDPASITVPLDGSGFLVPRTEGLLVTACSWASSKWAHLAAGDQSTVVLRASVGRAGDERGLDLDDDDLAAAVAAELGRTMGLTGAPTGHRVTRWPHSFPQYAPGHLARVDALEAAVAEASTKLGRPMVVAGAALRGLGIPACIRQGRQAARTVLGREDSRGPEVVVLTRMVVGLRRRLWNTLSLALIVLAISIAGALLVANRPAAQAELPVKIKVPLPLPLFTTTTLPPTTTTTAPPPPATVPTPVAAPSRDYMGEEVVEIGRLEIPALGLDTPIYEGNSLTVIDHGPGHWPGTAMPGHLGNVVLAGHRVTHSRPFRYMDTLQEGDQAIFTTVDGVFVYGFAGIDIVTPNRIDIVNQTEEYRATFFACHPPGSARYRIVSHWNLLSAPATNASNVLPQPAPGA